VQAVYRVELLELGLVDVGALRECIKAALEGGI